MLIALKPGAVGIRATTSSFAALIAAIVPSPSLATYAVWLNVEKAIAAGCEPTFRSFKTVRLRMSTSERVPVCLLVMKAS